MISAPQIVHTEALITASIHLTVARAEIAKVMGPAIAEVLAALKAQGLAPAGPCFSHHFRRPSESFDFAVGFPAPRAVQPTGRVSAGQLPAARVVRSVYQGAYEGLGAAWGQLFAWIAEAELVPGAGLWECYLTDPGASPDPASWRTELNCPLAD